MGQEGEDSGNTRALFYREDRKEILINQGRDNFFQKGLKAFSDIFKFKLQEAAHFNSVCSSYSLNCC